MILVVSLYSLRDFSFRNGSLLTPSPFFPSLIGKLCLSPLYTLGLIPLCFRMKDM